MNKAKKAFIVLALCQSRDEKAAKQVRIAVLKNRDGPAGGEDIPVEVNTAGIRVKEISPAKSVHFQKSAGKAAARVRKEPKKYKVGSEIRKHTLEGKWAQLA
jgi:hypothetical protein